MNRFDDLFDEADAAFNATYQEELNQLKSLSPEVITSITPNIKEYTALIRVVEKASKENSSKAQLVENIKGLGKIAVTIAKKIPQFSELL